jgi:hypothetical protein
MVSRTVASLRVLVLLLFGTVAGSAHAQLSVIVNGSTFQPGDTIRATLAVGNPGPAVNADFYFGVVHPDGITATFITNLSPLAAIVRRLDGDPQTFPALQSNVAIPAGFNTVLNDFFVYTLSALEPAGNYSFFAVLTTPRAFANSVIEPFDILTIDTTVFAIASAPSRGARR